MEAKSSSQMERLFTDICQLRSRHVGMFVHVSERENSFWPNCSKIAIDFARNCKISQNIQEMVFFNKKCFFFPENIHFFMIAQGGKSAVKCVSNSIISSKRLFPHNYEVFLAKKNQKTLNVLKIRKYDEERVSFEKNVFIFLKAFFRKNGKKQNKPMVAGLLVLQTK